MDYSRRYSARAGQAARGSARASPDGPRSTGATRCPGRTASASTSGMSTTSRLASISGRSVANAVKVMTGEGVNEAGHATGARIQGLARSSRRDESHMTPKPPAVLGGEPPLRVAAEYRRPGACRDRGGRSDRIAEILANGQLTNDSPVRPRVRGGAREPPGRPGRRRTSNGTWSLVLAMKQLGIEGEVIVPSYTYCASAHAIRWAGAEPVFADVLPDTFTLDPGRRPRARSRRARRRSWRCTSTDTRVKSTNSRRWPQEKGLALLFDAAHAFGALYRGRQVGTFGHAESFSFHATKTLPVGEGGCVSDRGCLAGEAIATLRASSAIRVTRTPSSPGPTRRCRSSTPFLGWRDFERLTRPLAAGGSTPPAFVSAFRIPLVSSFNASAPMPARAFKTSRCSWMRTNSASGVTRPIVRCPRRTSGAGSTSFPAHRHDAYAAVISGALPVTEHVADRVLCLPFYSHMTADQLDGMANAFEKLHAHAPRVRRALRDS